MRCPFCGSDNTQVKDSRPTEDNTAIRRRRLGSGEGHADVDELLRDTRGLHDIACLAMYNNTRQGAEVLPRLNKTKPRWADAFVALKRGAHGDLSGYHHGLRDLIADTRRICGQVSSWG